MPSPWSLIDASFPTFTGDERAKDQVEILLNYMYMLSEGLKYQLSNLNSQNFNATALRDIQIETTADVEAALGDVLTELDVIQNSIGTLRSGLSSILEWQDSANKQFSDLSEQQKSFSDALAAQEEDIKDLSSLIRKNSDGSIAVGSSGVVLHLLGQVYINNKLVE